MILNLKLQNCLNYLLKVMKIANEGNVDDPYNTEDRPCERCCMRTPSFTSTWPLSARTAPSWLGGLQQSLSISVLIHWVHPGVLQFRDRYSPWWNRFHSLRYHKYFNKSSLCVWSLTSENQTTCLCAHASKILVTCKQGGLNKEMDNVSNITVSLSRFNNLRVRPLSPSLTIHLLVV